MPDPNTEPPSVQTPIENNNIVALSDYDAALKAIEATFDGFQFQQPQPDSGNSEQQQLDQERIDEIYKACKESLVRNLDRIIRPVSDDDFHDYVDPYHYVQESIEDYDGGVSEEELEFQKKIAETIKEGEKEDEVDEEDLIDEKVWKQARFMRVRIREMSTTIQSVRDRLLQKSKEGVSSHFQPQLVDKPVEIVDSEEENTEDPTVALQDSLQTLSQILQDPQWSKLPHCIQSLQETIEAIQKETAEDRQMSQTERAILSQNDDNQMFFVESSRKLLEESSDGVAEEQIVNAMDRLAMLGQCF
jgi:hypothetical protein